MPLCDNFLSKLLADCGTIEFPEVREDSTTPYTDATGIKAVADCKNVSSRTKRPMNAFMIWSHAIRRTIVRRRPGLHNAEISRQLGRVWNQLTHEQRRPFIDEAERLRRFHSLEFPEYKYRPRRKCDTASALNHSRSSATRNSGKTNVITRHRNRISRTRTTSTSDQSDRSTSTYDSVIHSATSGSMADTLATPGECFQTVESVDAQLHTRLWLSRLPVYQPTVTAEMGGASECDVASQYDVTLIDDYLTPEVNELLENCDWLLDSDSLWGLGDI